MRRIRFRSLGTATLAAVCSLSGCAGAAHSERSTLQQKLGPSQGGLGSDELRLRLYELPARLSAVIEDAAERIRDGSSDPVTRRRALVWMTDGIPALYTASLRPDPLAGALDLWVLLEQTDFYFDGGAGKDAFGAEQPIAVGASKRMIELYEQTAEPLFTDNAVFQRRKSEVQAFARAHPIGGSFSSRETALTALARFSAGESEGTLAQVAQATDTLADVSLRLNAYVTLLPKLTRWEAQLTVDEVAGRDNLGGTLEDVHAISETARRAGELLADIPGATRQASGPIQELIERERGALLAEVDRERAAMTAYVTSERIAALAAIGEERKAALAGVDQERIAAVAGVDALARRSIEDASTRARGIVDAVFWRGLILIAVAALLFGLSFRIARGRREARP